MIDERSKVENELREFPGEFCLKGFPGRMFRVAEWPTSYWPTNGVESQIVVQVKLNDRWADFSRTTAAQLRCQIRRLA